MISPIRCRQCLCTFSPKAEKQHECHDGQQPSPSKHFSFFHFLEPSFLSVRKANSLCSTHYARFFFSLCPVMPSASFPISHSCLSLILVVFASSLFFLKCVQIYVLVRKKRTTRRDSLLLFFFLAGKGTRTPTSWTPDPKSGASANSAIPAYLMLLSALCDIVCSFGTKKRWVKGFEPSISRATIWRPNQLGHTHHSHGFFIIKDVPLPVKRRCAIMNEL